MGPSVDRKAYSLFEPNHRPRLSADARLDFEWRLGIGIGSLGGLDLLVFLTPFFLEGFGDGEQEEDGFDWFRDHCEKLGRIDWTTGFTKWFSMHLVVKSIDITKLRVFFVQACLVGPLRQMSDRLRFRRCGCVPSWVPFIGHKERSLGGHDNQRTSGLLSRGIQRDIS